MGQFHTTFTLAENALLLLCIVEDSNELNRHCAPHLEPSPCTLCKIMPKDPGLRVYKIYLERELKPCDRQARCTFGV